MRHIHKCMRKGCGHSWMSHKEHPKECPKCKSTKWDVESMRIGRPRKMASA